jgi:hypothetical protein
VLILGGAAGAPNFDAGIEDRAEVGAEDDVHEGDSRDVGMKGPGIKAWGLGKQKANDILGPTINPHICSWSQNVAPQWRDGIQVRLPGLASSAYPGWMH